MKRVLAIVIGLTVFAAGYAVASITAPRSAASDTATLLQIEYLPSGGARLQWQWSCSDGDKFKPVDINADGSVTDWRGQQIYAPGVATGRLNTLNTLRSNLDSDMSTAVGNGKIVSGCQ